MFGLYYIFVDTKLCTEEMHSHVFVYTFKVNITFICGLYCYILDRIHSKQYFMQFKIENNYLYFVGYMQHFLYP